MVDMTPLLVTVTQQEQEYSYKFVWDNQSYSLQSTNFPFDDVAVMKVLKEAIFKITGPRMVIWK